MASIKKVIDFAITNHCQARCRSCIRTNAETGKPEDWIKLRHQPFELFKRNTTGINKDEICFVKFCGQNGDPVMHPNIADFINHAFTFSNEVMLNTNGGLRKPEWYTELGNKHGHGLTVYFGIDGIDHDTNWKYREGVNFKRAMENMQALSDSKAKACWHFLIFDWNWHQIPDAAKIAQDMGVEIQFKMNTSNYGLLDPSKKEMVENLICQNTV